MRIFLLLFGLVLGVGLSAVVAHHHYDRLAEMGIVPAQPAIQTNSKTEVINKSVNPCAWRETRPISFTSWDDKDLATVEVFGPDCDFSVISLTIRDENQRVVLHEIAEFSGITPNRETQEEMEAIIASFWDGMGPKRTSEFGDWLPQEEMFEDGNQWTSLSKEKYDRARADDAPLICMAVFYETTHCYWRDVERNFTERMISFGA